MRILANTLDTIRDLRHPKYRVTFAEWHGRIIDTERTITVRAWDPEDAYWRAVVKGMRLSAHVTATPIRISGGGHTLDLLRPCPCTTGCNACLGSGLLPAVGPDDQCPDCHGDGITREPDGNGHIPCACVLTALAKHWTP